MSGQKTQKPLSRIPKFKSYEEEADFWDTHSPEDFPGEFEEVDVTFARPLEIVRVRDWRKTLAGALAGLSPDQRQALALNMLGLRPEDVASVLGWTPAKCRKAIREARQRTNV